MKVTEIDKQFKQVAGLLGCIQGFAWFIMSLICIILYTKGDEYNYLPDSYMEAFQQMIYLVFLAKHDDLSYKGRLVTPTVFHILMWPYLICDLIWFIVSVWLIITKRDKTITTLSKAWVNIVTIISIYDLFVTILLGVQYDKCLDNSIVMGEFCANAILPVLVIAARGFVLWIVNVVFARILFVRIVKEARRGTVFHENLVVSFQAPYPEPVPPIVNSLNFQNWENQIDKQQPPTPTHGHRVTSPNIHSVNGERFQHSPILSTNASQDLNRNRFNYFEQYTSSPTNSNANAPNVNNRQHVLSPRPNFVTNNGLQSENRFQYPGRLPRPDFDRAPVSLPSRY